MVGVTYCLNSGMVSVLKVPMVMLMQDRRWYWMMTKVRHRQGQTSCGVLHTQGYFLTWDNQTHTTSGDKF